tara:strand:+ start:219 stop:536 length:318 start_codon:yes stop_codon:yes gene_type:complete
VHFCEQNLTHFVVFLFFSSAQVMYYESFATFSTAMLATFRLATGSGWHELLYMYWECGPSVPFFVSFHFTFCILFYNILGGLIFAQYKQVSFIPFSFRLRWPLAL